MEELKKIEELTGHVREYVQVRITETRLLLAGRTAKVMSQLIADATVLLVFGVGVLFAAAAGALALGRWLNNTALGFLIVAGFFLLSVILIRLGKQRLIRTPVMNEIIYQLFEKDENDEED